MLFGIAGAVGFVVDTAVLYALKGTIGPYAARLVSFLAAVATTWLINRSLAFRQRAGARILREFLTYLASMLAGGAVNLGIYAVMIATLPIAAQHPVLAIAAGVAGGMVANFILAERVVFGGRPRG
jgi:putative flippase GtrA